MVKREAFGVKLNGPFLNTHTHTHTHTHTQRKEMRNNNCFTFVFIRDHLLTVCSSWLRQRGKFVSQSPGAETAAGLPGG